MVQEAEDGVRRRVFTGISGTIPDCYAAREDIATGMYSAICDRTTMRKAMSWDFRWVTNTQLLFFSFEYAILFNELFFIRVFFSLPLSE